jgi:hypothetical protein
LSRAHEIHKYNRECDELHTRIKDKTRLASNDYYGQDVPSVERLQREHEGLERDASGALRPTLDQLHAECERLSAAFPDQAPDVQQRDTALAKLYQTMVETIEFRKVRLSDHHDMQQLYSWHTALMGWIREMIKRIEREQPSTDAVGANVVLVFHQSLKSEIDARTVTVDELAVFGRKLVAARHFAAVDIDMKVQQVLNGFKALNQLWDVYHDLFEQSRDALQLRQDISQAERWMAAYTPQVALERPVNSINDAENELQRMQGFEKSVAARTGITQSLQRLTKVCCVVFAWLSVSQV